jgi:membrane protein DedA with SNARE-associated domain
MEQIVTAWLAHYGAPALFFLLMLGVFGLPVPDETLLVFAGLLVSRGELSPVPTATAAVSGAMAGITVSFSLGRFAGFPLLRRYGPSVRVSHAMLDRVEHWFARIGKWLLAAGYFLPGVRHLTALVAGASGLPAWTFAAFAYSGALVWVSCFLVIGYTIGDEWRRLAADLHQQVATAAGLVVVIILAAILWRRQSPETRQD